MTVLFKPMFFLFQTVHLFHDLKQLKDNLLKLLVLAVDLVTSFVLAVISYNKNIRAFQNDSNLTAGFLNSSNVTAEAVASAGVFGFMGLLYILIVRLLHSFL